LAAEAATCLDLALLFAAIVEAAGGAPAILIVRRAEGLHAIGGSFDMGAELDIDHVTTDAEAIRALVTDRKLTVVETTGLSATRGKKKPFDRACDEAVGLLTADTPLALINVMAARKLGIKPPD